MKLAPDSRAQAPATVIRMQIQPRNRFRRSQQHRQLQLCVPLVTPTGAHYRSTAPPLPGPPPLAVSEVEIRIGIALTDLHAA